VIEGKRLTLPGLSLAKEVGRGANAVVFEALDDDLHRPVAVKVWNARGTDRAQIETTKIARLNHPFILTVHRFGVIEGHPYAVMELVSGVTGKEWLQSPRSVDERLEVWRMYADTLAFIHAQGLLHGDPHLGNVLIFEDSVGRFAGLNPQKHPFALKIADMGTSAFWTDHGAFERREAQIIVETMGRLFPDRALHLDRLKPGLSHQDSLELMDRIAVYLK
jgi:serine/threonine protein kinase